MNKQRILKEAQKIAKQYSFWMVSGNISHLYGYVYESKDTKYELEIRFDSKFPDSPPKMIYHNEIRNLLGNIQLNNLINWTANSNVIDIVNELKDNILSALKTSEKIQEDKLENIEKENLDKASIEKEEFVTPDLNAYPPDFQYNEYITPSESANDLFFTEKPSVSSTQNLDSNIESKTTYIEEFIEQNQQLGVLINTELSLIQQEYAYDQPDSRKAVINVYITITLTKTFIITIDLINFPEKPNITFPDEINNIIGDPYTTIDLLRNWNSKKPSHIIDILHKIEKRLFFIKEIETQLKKISGEYQCESISNNFTKLKVILMTYGFREYFMNIDLEPYPKPPKIDLDPELQEIIKKPIEELKTFKNWIENKTDPVAIVREISWLVDKNSRINFEIDLLKDHYKNINYDPLTAILSVEMRGKMKTEDLTFKFQINLPIDYPMKMPEVKVINEFDLEAHEKIKNDLDASFNNFFEEWTPFSYLVDLFNLISKKIFEISIVSCVICHKIECPSCTKRIAGDDNCHTECPHCNRAYHKHCWEQTIKSFGKCGFCLR
jgi:ubiquitin-protein ligase